ncbi:MAG: helicase-related protein [Evtepia gabavorous]
MLSVAEDLRQAGKAPAIIYGALPYATRRKQMEGFLAGQMDYVVSTDAIGMGLNLPIRRILFMDTEKFDGVERRALKPEEIQQIAGRAGRYGMYDKGYVGATQNLGAIRAGLNTVVPPPAGGGRVFRPGSHGRLRPVGGPHRVEQDAHGGALCQAGYHPVSYHHLQAPGAGLPTDQGAGAPGSQHPL